MTAVLIAGVILAAALATSAGLACPALRMAVSVCWYRLRYAPTIPEAITGAGNLAAALGVNAAAGTTCMIARAARAGCTLADRYTASVITPRTRKDT